MDPITFIENAFKDAVKGVEDVTAVLGPEDLPVRDRDYPAALVDAGTITPVYLGGEEGGDRLIELTVQFDVMTALDGSAKDFKPRSRALMFRVLAALSDLSAMGLDAVVEEISLKGCQVQEYASEKGVQGGHHLAFTVQFTVRETSPGVIEPRQ